MMRNVGIMIINRIINKNKKKANWLKNYFIKKSQNQNNYKKKKVNLIYS